MTSPTVPAMPVSDELAEELRTSAYEARKWMALRDGLAVEAVQLGGSLREVAALIGLSHAGVKRIIERAK